jgi:hypothetical protein
MEIKLNQTSEDGEQAQHRLGPGRDPGRAWLAGAGEGGPGAGGCVP